MISVKKSIDRPHIVLGRNIAHFRKTRGFEDQEDLARKAGVGISALKDIERGISEGTLETRKTIAQTLKCSLAELYMAPGESSKLTQSDLVSLVEPILALGRVTPLQAQAVKAFLTGHSSHLDILPESQARRLRDCLKAL